MSNDTKTISKLMDQMISELGDDDKACLGDMFDAFGNRAYGPFLFALAIVTISPISAIPGISIALGFIINLIAGQYFFGENRPWIPQTLEQKSMSAEKANDNLKKVKPYLEKIEAIIKPRLTFFTQPPFDYAVMVVVIVLGLSMFPLAAVPWGVMAPGFALLFLSLGIVAKDGLVVIFGLAISIAAIYVVIRYGLS